MIEDPSDVTDIVARIESGQNEWVTLANEMEEMWALELWDAESDEERTYVTSSQPYNSIAAARRMLNTVEPNIECPALGFTAEADTNQQNKERWLKALWQRIRIERKENVISSAFWQSLVLGKGVFQALWVGDVMPKRLKDHKLPFLVRTLDPRLCGFEDGPLYMQYAYYKPTMQNISIKQQYPDYEYEADDEDAEVEVTDFWWIDPESGSVWNAVVANEEWIMEPTQTKYYDIPLVPFSGSFQPSTNTKDRHGSFLYPLRNSWEVSSDTLTMIATNLLYYLVPPVALINENGEALNDNPLQPGEYRQFPAGTAVTPITVAPNAPLAEQVLRHMEGEISESTFTGVGEGGSLGSTQAGYAYSQAMAADEGRIQEWRDNLQVAISTVNELVLGFVDSMAGSKGVTMQGKSGTDGGRYIVQMDKEAIGGNYMNEVRLKPMMERDTAAMIAMGQRLVDGRTISRATMRDLFLPMDVPDDEQMRIELEAAMMNETTAPIVALHTLEAYQSPSPAIQNIIEVLRAQVDAQMAQLQAQQQAPDGSGGALPPPDLGAGGPGGPPGGPPGGLPIQPPAIGGGILPAQAEGQITDATIAAGAGETVTPDILSGITGGAP